MRNNELCDVLALSECYLWRKSWFAQKGAATTVEVLVHSVRTRVLEPLQKRSGLNYGSGALKSIYLAPSPAPEIRVAPAPQDKVSEDLL